MRAGTAIRDISPSGPLPLCGYPESPVSTGVHDPLYLAAFYLSDGETEGLYLTADLCFFAQPRAERIAGKIAEATGIPADNILLAATHTHYAPATDCDIYREVLGPELCPDYMDFVQAMAVEAALEAVDTAFAARLAWRTGCCGREQGIGGNRHDPERYAQDPSVTVLALRDETETVRGILVNYALHPTVLDTRSSLVTADYVAYVRQTVGREYPEAVFGFMQGCSGNQSSRWFRREQTFREAERFGSAIGAEVLRLLQSAEFRPVRGPLRIRKLEFMPTQVRHIPPLETAAAQAADARSAYDEAVGAGAPEAVRRSAECTLLGAEQMELYARGAERYGEQAILATTVPVVLQLLTMGELAIVGIGAEVFAEVGLAVKAKTPFPATMLSCLTGGCPCSYLCADYAYDQLCYEAAGSLFARGTAGELAGFISASLNLLTDGDIL